MQVGDDVVIISHPDKPQGVITQVWPGAGPGGEDEYDVVFGEGWIPDHMRFSEKDLIRIIPELPKGQELKCWCGRDTVGEGRHSDYCPKAILNGNL